MRLRSPDFTNRLQNHATKSRKMTLQSMRCWALISLFLTVFGLSATQGADSSSGMQDSMESKRPSKPRMFRWEGRDGSAPAELKRSRTESSWKPRIFQWKKESGAYSGDLAGKKKKSKKARAEKEDKGKPRDDSVRKRTTVEGQKKKPRLFRWEK